MQGRNQYRLCIHSFRGTERVMWFLVIPAQCAWYSWSLGFVELVQSSLLLYNPVFKNLHWTYWHARTHTELYFYIYLYIQREKEREREREGKGETYLLNCCSFGVYGWLLVKFQYFFLWEVWMRKIWGFCIFQSLWEQNLDGLKLQKVTLGLILLWRKGKVSW